MLLVNKTKNTNRHSKIHALLSWSYNL